MHAVWDVVCGAYMPLDVDGAERRDSSDVASLPCRTREMSRPARRARSPGSSWRTSRPCWPGRTARCCSAISAPTSSRSSHPAGIRHGAMARPTRRAPRPRATPDDPGESAYYLSINRNKRGISVDLRGDAGREVLRRLLGRADVLIENFRAGALRRDGLRGRRSGCASTRAWSISRSPATDRPARTPTSPASTSSSRPSRA